VQDGALGIVGEGHVVELDLPSRTTSGLAPGLSVISGRTFNSSNIASMSISPCLMSR
jgi:hypothetical protein